MIKRLATILVVLASASLLSVAPGMLKHEPAPINLRYTNRSQPFLTLSADVYRDRIEIRFERTGRPPGENGRMVFSKAITQEDSLEFSSEWRALTARHPELYKSANNFEVSVTSGAYQCLANSKSKGKMEQFLFQNSLVAEFVRESLRKCSAEHSNHSVWRSWTGVFAESASVQPQG